MIETPQSVPDIVKYLNDLSTKEKPDDIRPLKRRSKSTKVLETYGQIFLKSASNLKQTGRQNAGEQQSSEKPVRSFTNKEDVYLKGGESSSTALPIGATKSEPNVQESTLFSPNDKEAKLKPRTTVLLPFKDGKVEWHVQGQIVKKSDGSEANIALSETAVLQPEDGKVVKVLVTATSSPADTLEGTREGESHKPEDREPTTITSEETRLKHVAGCNSGEIDSNVRQCNSLKNIAFLYGNTLTTHLPQSGLTQNDCPRRQQSVSMQNIDRKSVTNDVIRPTDRKKETPHVRSNETRKDVFSEASVSTKPLALSTDSMAISNARYEDDPEFKPSLTSSRRTISCDSGKEMALLSRSRPSLRSSGSGTDQGNPRQYLKRPRRLGAMLSNASSSSLSRDYTSRRNGMKIEGKGRSSLHSNASITSGDLKESRSSSGVTGSSLSMAQTEAPSRDSVFDQQSLLTEHSLPRHAKGRVTSESEGESTTSISIVGCSSFVLNTSSVEDSLNDQGPSVPRTKLAILSESQNTVYIEDSTRYVLKDHFKRNVFCNTRAYQACSRKLEEMKFLIITGEDALTYTGLQLLVESKRTHKCFICNPVDFNHAFLQDDSIVHVSHAFGNQEFELVMHRHFMRYVREIISACRNTNMAVITTIKDSVATECRDFMNEQESYIVDMSAAENILNDAEKVEILEKHLMAVEDVRNVHLCESEEDENVYDRCVADDHPIYISKSTLRKMATTAFTWSFWDDINSYVSSRRNIQKGVAFFQDPSPRLLEMVNGLRTAVSCGDKESFLALVAVLVLNGRLDQERLQHYLHCSRTSRETEQQGQDASALAMCSTRRRVVPVNSDHQIPVMLPLLLRYAAERQMSNCLGHHVCEGARRLRNRLLVEDDNRVFRFSSECVRRVVMMSCAESDPEVILRNCGDHFLQRYVAIPTQSQLEQSKQMAMILLDSDDKKKLLAKILLEDILRGKVRQSTEHPAMLHPWFVDTVFRLALEKRKQLWQLFTAIDKDTDMPLVYHGLDCIFQDEPDACPQNLTEKILLTNGWQDKRQEAPEALLQESLCLEKVCSLGIGSTYRLLVCELKVPATFQCLKNAVEAGRSEIVFEILSLKPCQFSLQQLRDVFFTAYTVFGQRGDEAARNIFVKLSKYAGENCRLNTDAVVHLAARAGDVTVLSILLGLNADVNQSNGEGYTPLHLACRYDHELCTQKLLTAGASQLECDVEGDLPVHTAAQHGHTNIVRLLIESNQAVINLQDAIGRQPLHLASNKATAVLLIENDADVNFADHQKRTPLHLAAGSPFAEVQHLLEANADVNKMDIQGETPIVAACRSQNVEAAKILIKQIDVTSTENAYAMFEAVKNENEALVDVLMGAGFSVNMRNKDNVTLLHFAIINGLKKGIAILLARNASTELASDGLYPVHKAVQRNEISVLQQLIQSGASAGKHTEDGRHKHQTVLHLAVMEQNTTIVAYLLENFPELAEERNRRGEIPLHIAARLGDLPAVILLLEAESGSYQKMARTNRWETALDIARGELLVGRRRSDARAIERFQALVVFLEEPKRETAV